MLRDGVCDDPTNTLSCLYDGGDCCLPNKATHLCRDCTCILEVDFDDISQKFTEFEVDSLATPLAFDNRVSWIERTVSDVIDVGVCTMICLDNELMEIVNAWQYDDVSKRCKCGWIDFYTDELISVAANNPFSGISLCSTVAFVQFSKMFNASEMTIFNLIMLDSTYLLSYYLGCLDIDVKEVSEFVFENKAEASEKTLSARMCQKSCMEEDSCRRFSWSYHITSSCK